MAAADVAWPFSDSSSRSGALSYVRALLNILEDTAAEKEQLHGAQSAVLNILEDAASEKQQLNETQSAVLSVLEDFAAEKSHLEDMKKAVVNILDDLGVEKRQLGERTVQLEAANKELEAFAYSVSHDLRAPLRGIDGWSMALLEDYAGRLDADGQAHLHRIRESARRMNRLIDDLLMLSRMTRAELHRQTVDLTGLARSVLARLQLNEPERKAELVVADGLVVDADAHLMGILMENLLGNAWKFTSKQPMTRVEVGTQPQNGEPVVFIRDNGAGFDMAYAVKLFGAFQRLHSAAEYEGTGIGLATVHRIVTRHGGRIWAEAQVDRGATFYFTL